MFNRPGLTVFYRIPQETYEAWLPLDATPKPGKCVRVGLVVHAHLEPELEAHVDALIKKLSNESFDVRDAAQKELLLFGGAAFPQLEKGLQHADAETREHCATILKALDVRPAVDGSKNFKASE